MVARFRERYRVTRTSVPQTSAILRRTPQLAQPAGKRDEKSVVFFTDNGRTIPGTIPSYKHIGPADTVEGEESDTAEGEESTSAPQHIGPAGGKRATRRRSARDATAEGTGPPGKEQPNRTTYGARSAVKENGRRS